MKKNECITSIHRMLNPVSVAVVGVSKEGFGFGKGILLSLLAMKFSGKLYPVNPKGGEIAGLAIYPSVEEIPGRIDFAIIAVPAPMVPAALESCRKKGAAGAEILSSGFDEAGTAEGHELAARLREIIDRGMRVIGPNCFGIYNPRCGLTMLPGPDLSREPGNVAFISQSGGMSIDLSHMGKWKGIKFSAVVSYGNGIDLRESELLEYFNRDPDTDVIGMYIEGVQDGRRFFDSLKEASACKPVVVLKGGLSEAGGRAVESHTASMGGKSVLWESLLKQCNAVQVKNIRELGDTLLAMTLIPPGRYRGISIVGGGGALGVAAADAAESLGMVIPALKDPVRDAVYALLPKPGSSARNPIDIANPFVSPDFIRRILVETARDERIDIQVIIQLLYHYKSLAVSLGMASVKDCVPVKELADAVRSAVDETGKPAVMVMPNFKRHEEDIAVEEVMRLARKEFLQRRIPVFDELEDALVSVDHLSRWHEKKRERGV